jgi:uncharacterized protein (TIGR03000 family)
MRRQSVRKANLAAVVLSIAAFQGAAIGGGDGQHSRHAGLRTAPVPVQGKSAPVRPAEKTRPSPPGTPGAAGIQQASFASTQTGTSGRLSIKLPAEAEVWIGGQRTNQTGPLREFVSPPLEPGMAYNYQVRIRWIAAGKVFEDARTITVRAGAVSDVDLTHPGQ